MENLRRQLLPVITFIKIDVRRLFRDKVAIFFVFVFPLIFLLIFGTIFNSDNAVSFRVALINQSQSEFAAQFASDIEKNEIFKVDSEVTNLEAAREKMSRGQLDAAIILPEQFGVPGDTSVPRGQATILYDENNTQAGRTLGTIMEAIFKDINKELVPSDEPFTVAVESTATKGLTQFDYTFSGILGFVLLSLGVFGPTSVFPRLKQRGVLRRYHTTTLRVWQYFVGNVLSNAVVGILAVTVMLIVAFTMFDLNMRGNYATLFLVTTLGTILMFGIGLALGGWAKNENQAAPLAQVVALPMMFLSGVFFPTFLMPQLLQTITQFIPLTPVVDAIRMVITENASLIDLGPQLGIMVVWTVAIYAVAFRVFRWE